MAIEHWIKLKNTAGRSKDPGDIVQLRAIQERWDEKREIKRGVCGRREVYEHLHAFLRLSHTDRGRWLGEALALADAVKAGRAGRRLSASA